VVEKCNFCEERLAKGLGPWCVEACRNVGAVAMVFGDLTDTNSEISRLLAASFTLRRKPHLGTQPSVFYIV
jgi:molybdopterin-containing oxidoreductase family iron-sulfur binding subunit